MMAPSRLRTHPAIAVLLIAIVSTAMAQYNGGSGTAEDPYIIATAAQLNAIGACLGDWDKHFRLTADIDLSGFSYDRAVIAPDVNDTEPDFQGTAFAGVFDGDGHMILHLTITGGDYVGLFGKLAESAEIRNLGVTDVDITGSGAYGGGLAGANSGSMTQCYSTGSVYCTWIDVGGLVGVNQGTVAQCLSDGSVASNSSAVGGLVGSNTGSVAQSYASARVSAAALAGGLVGENWGRVTHCYSTGSARGSFYVGGLVGGSFDGTVTVCFWDTQTSGLALSAGGTGKTTAEMRTARTFLDAGWDFVGETANGTEDIWAIVEGQDYPRFWWTTQLLFASMPSPPTGAEDISRSPLLSWTGVSEAAGHDVYFGDDGDIIAAATPETPDAYQGREIAEVCTYDPGVLDWGTTYYWRIDEVNEADPDSPWKGRIWSFATTMCIKSPQPANGAADVARQAPLSWVPGGPDLEYDIYLGETEDRVLNATTASTGIYRGRQPPEEASYVPVGLKWGKTYYWRVDGFDEADPSSPWKGGVWNFTTAYFATSPYPADGDVIGPTQSLVLHWATAEPDSDQDVYFGEDEIAVSEATTETPGIYRGRQASDQSTYAPGDLELGRTYYWRIDGIDKGDPGSPCKGVVWSFTTVELVVVSIVDNFESYTDDIDAGETIWQTWIDGLTTGASGSIVGYFDAPFAERTIVHSGLQSMPLAYENGNAPWYSEVERTWATSQDWTSGGADTLTLYFRGEAGNNPERLYVSIQDGSGRTAVVVHPDAEALLATEWQTWDIPLAEMQAAGPGAVRKMVIGLGDRNNPKPGGAGLIYIDDICLTKRTP